MHYHRKPFIGDNRDPWESLFINVEKENIGDARPNPIVNIAGSTALHMHEITFVTGTSSCRAHAFAKMMAAAVLDGKYDNAQSLKVARQHDQDKPFQGKVLWIDSVHSFYTSCGIIDDIKKAVSVPVNNDNFSFMCLDDIGSFNECNDKVLSCVTNAIRDFNPTLVIIDDLDHLTPECGINKAENFYLQIREILDHYDLALLCVGYNLIGRAKSTAGYIGKRLFPIANNVFRITNRGTTAIVQRVKGITDDDQFEFAFTINDSNCSQEVILTPAYPADTRRFVETTAVQDIFSSVISRDEALPPDKLITKLNKRQDGLNRLNRNRHLIANALAQGIIRRNKQGNYTINPKACKPVGAANPSYNDDISSYIDKLQRASEIPLIRNNKGINYLTYFKRSARPATITKHP